MYITNKFNGTMKVDGIEGKELTFFNIDNLPQEITPSHKPILKDMKNRLLHFFQISDRD